MAGFALGVLHESWAVLVRSAIYMLFGIFVAGLVYVFLRPKDVARHLAGGRVLSVLKASLIGIPLPLCSCAVLPTAAAVRKRGASRGATTAFLITTPESGADSIALTYALMGPLMTLARPIAAFFTGITAGLLAGASEDDEAGAASEIDLSCPIDRCCDGQDCPPELHSRHHSWREKFLAGMRFAWCDLWPELAGWFFFGVFLAGVIAHIVPDDILLSYLNGGLEAMLIMLVIGMPLYICAAASTPIAAALVLKGVSPGAALVFLLAGPATNAASLAVLVKIIGRKAVLIYLATIAVCSSICGLLLDAAYAYFGISPRAVMGQAGEVFPRWIEISSTLLLVLFSLMPLVDSLKRRK